MKIAIYIGGAQDGFDTPGSGEPRLAYNTAHMLALNGHDVIAFGTGHGGHEPPLWGRQKPIPGVTFVHPYDVLGQTFDMVLNMPFDLWYKGTVLKAEEIDIRSPFISHTIFTQSGIKSYLRDYSHLRRVVLMPYRIEHSSFVSPCSFDEREQELIRQYIRWLPFPYYQAFDKTPLAARKEMTWVGKSLFSDEWPTDRDFHVIGRDCLEAVKNFANRNNITINFAMAPMFEGKRADRLGVTKIFNEIRSKKLFGGLLPYNKLNDCFSKSAVNIALPNFASSCFNAIASGCITAFYDDDIMFGSALSVLNFRSTENVSEIEAKLESLYFDSTLYNRLIREQQQKIFDYSYDNSYSKFFNICEEFVRQ